MKKYILFIIASLFFIATPLSFAASNNVAFLRGNQNRHRAKVVTAYISSLIMSGGIGAATGGILRHLEKRVNIEDNPLALLFLLLGWALESEVRNDIILGLQQTMDEYGIAYKKSLMFTGSRLASWISYLHTA